MITSPSWGSRTILTLTAAFIFLTAFGCASSDMFANSDDARNAGIQQYNDHQYADAAGSFRNAARQDPRDYKALYYLGASYQQLNEYHQAIEAYKSSLDSQTRTLAGQDDHAGRLRTLDALAGLIAKMDTRDAETNLLESKARQTQASIDYFVLAKVYRYRGDIDSALDYYNRAALKDPKDFALQKEYGLFLEQLGQNQRAEIPLRRAFTLNQKDQEVAAALRRLGVVPGPALKDRDQLAEPPIPVGPIPEVNLSNFKISGSNQQQQSGPQPSAQPPAPSAQPPQQPEVPPKD